MLTNLVSSNYFFVIFIALVVVFFLLGLVLGLVINLGKRVTEDKQAPAIDNNTETTKPTDIFIQDEGEEINNQNIKTNQKPTSYKERYHDNYW